MRQNEVESLYMDVANNPNIRHGLHKLSTDSSQNIVQEILQMTPENLQIDSSHRGLQYFDKQEYLLSVDPELLLLKSILDKMQPKK